MSTQSQAPQIAELLKELQSEYIESFPKKMALYTQLVKQKDAAGLGREFHKLKGTGTTYGIPEITIVAEVVEQLCHRAGPEVSRFIPVAVELLQQICRARAQGLTLELNQSSDFQKLQSFCQLRPQPASAVHAKSIKLKGPK